MAANPCLNWPAKVILGRIRWFARETGAAHCGEDLLASELGVGAATVRRAIRALENAKLIDITRRGKRLTNLYRPLEVSDQNDRSPGVGDRSKRSVMSDQNDRPLGIDQNDRSNSTERSRREELAAGRQAGDLAAWPKTAATMRRYADHQGWTVSDALIRATIAAALPGIPAGYDRDATLADAVYVADHQRSAGLWPRIIVEQLREYGRLVRLGALGAGSAIERGG